MRLFILGAFFLLTFCSIFSNDTIYVTLDLTNIQKDKLQVEITNLQFNQDTITYYIPEIAPGSYSIKNYGIYIDKLVGYDKNGKKIKFHKSDNNIFKSYKGKSLNRITYLVNDTWDDVKNKNYVFPPAGTNFEENENFVLNHYGVLGYFKNRKNYHYQLSIKKPESFYTSTALKIKRDLLYDTIWAKNYFELSDNPLMYSKPDTISFRFDNTNFYISVFSKNGVNKANQIKAALDSSLPAIKDFIGEIPIPEYHFILYLTGYQQEELNNQKLFGGMEHNNCSFYILPELYASELFKVHVNHILIHEFLHLITPLKLHDQYIQNFDFNKPKVSEHLWLYEGVTEYFANLVLENSNLISEDEFAERIRVKLLDMQNYPNDTLSVFSKKILSEEYNKNYMNIYSKGPIFALSLDLYLKKKTDDSLNLKELVLDLYNKYYDSCFNSDSLIFEIVENYKISGLDTFFNKYFYDNDSLPLKSLLSYNNWNLFETLDTSIQYFGNLSFYLKEGKYLFVNKAEKTSNRFGLKKGDQILAINDILVTPSNYLELCNKIYSPNENEKITIKYKRGKKEVFTWATPAKLDFKKSLVIKVKKH